jgi:hypothetical protein
MPVSSVEELKRRIAAGDYAIDSGKVAHEIVSKIAIVRRVKRTLAKEGDAAADVAARGPRPRTRGGSPSSAPHPFQSRRELLP